MTAEVEGGDSFTAACWAWSWKIKMTDKTDMMADKIPSKDRTIRERWLYLSDIFNLRQLGFLRRIYSFSFLVGLLLKLRQSQTPFKSALGFHPWRKYFHRSSPDECIPSPHGYFFFSVVCALWRCAPLPSLSMWCALNPQIKNFATTMEFFSWILGNNVLRCSWDGQRSLTKHKTPWQSTRAPN